MAQIPWHNKRPRLHEDMRCYFVNWWRWTDRLCFFEISWGPWAVLRDGYHGWMVGINFLNFAIWFGQGPKGEK